PLTVVLLHGFGAPGDDLVSLAGVLPRSARYVFPAAPLELDGMFGGRAPVAPDQARAGGARAWWLLDLARLEAELRAGIPRDRSDEIPAGLPAAREHVTRLLDQLGPRLGGGGKLVLGGFSQGAMLAIDVALHREPLPDAIVAMSGTLVAEAEWQPRMARLRGVPVFQSHGRYDMLLPFTVAETLRDRMRAAGATVDWQPFVGGHEIPPGVVGALSEFLTRSSGR
ncbi:MAG TPA: hypothetical protein VLX92_15880, partial [Kofleriaceae bacterium]|nr:hypothetical protein [Kofleriaceae bacterium]